MHNLPVLMHTYPAVNPWNVWDLTGEEFDLLLSYAKQE